jgi:hypothetical protein
MSTSNDAAKVLLEIKRQLDWRGPSGKAAGHVVIKRDDGQTLWDEFAKPRPADEKPADVPYDKSTAGRGVNGFLSSYRPELYCEE